MERARWRHTLELRSVGNWMVRSFWRCGVIYALTHTEVMPVQIVAQPYPSQAAAYAIVDIEIIANKKRWVPPPPPPHFVLFKKNVTFQLWPRFVLLEAIHWPAIGINVGKINCKCNLADIKSRSWCFLLLSATAARNWTFFGVFSCCCGNPITQQEFAIGKHCVDHVKINLHYLFSCVCVSIQVTTFQFKRGN